MSRIGMDVDAIRADAEQMERLADALTNVISSSNAVVSRMHGGWFGADAEHLVGRWQSQSRPTLEQVGVQIRDLAARARTEADQQIGASAAKDPGIGSWYGLPFRPEPPTLLDTAELITTLASVGITFASLSRGGSPILAAKLGALSDLSETGKLAAAGRVFEVVGVGTDAAKVYSDILTHNNLGATLYDSAHLAVGAAGLYFPPVGLGLAAWDTGQYVGKEIATIPVVAHQMNNVQNHALDVGSAAVGGDPSTDPAAAQRLVDRYKGVSGFFHAMDDSTGGKLRSLVGGFA